MNDTKGFTAEAFRERQMQLQQFVENCMVEGLHYGRVVGDKDTLLKPGGELLLQWYGLEPEFTLMEREMDWGDATTEPIFYFRYRCQLTLNGKRVGDGMGSANSREPKYRYRWMDYIPPGIDEALCETRTTKAEVFEWQYQKRETTGQYGKPDSFWKVFDEAIENETIQKFEKEKPWKAGEFDTALRVDAVKYRVPNPDIADYINTVEKMAQKRAFMQAILMAAGASQFFTQDLEDITEMGGVREWRPSWGDFYNRVIPAIPELLKGCVSKNDQVLVIGQLYKDKFKNSDKFDPGLAGEAHKYLLELNEQAKTPEIVAMVPREAFLWLAKLATDAATPETADTISAAIEQLTLSDEVEPEDNQWIESYDLLLEDVVGAGLDVVPPQIIRELAP